MPEQSILKILQYYAGYFAQSDLFGIGFVTLFRQLGWWILQGFAWVCDQLEGLVDTAYELINITTGAVAQKYYDKLTAILTLLATFALVILGLRFILGRKKRPQNVLGNIALAVAIITLLPLFLIKMNEGLFLFREQFSTPGISNSEQILMNSMTDLTYLETQNWYYDPLTGSFSDEGKPRMNTDLGLDNININETVDGDWGSVWRKRLLYDENGNAFIDNMKETSVLGVTIIPAQSYYRYHFDFLTPFITLLATIIAMFFSLWKIIRIIFEIVQNRFFATFMAFSDFSSGQRAKQFLRGIFDSYFVLLFITVIMQLFFVFQEYINAQSWNGLTKAFFIFLAALGVIDGPNMIERVFGIDAGLARSAVGTIANMSRAARGMKSASSAIKSGKKRIVEGTAAKAGYISGRFGGEKENSQKERVAKVQQSQQPQQEPSAKAMVPAQPGLQKKSVRQTPAPSPGVTEQGRTASIPQEKEDASQNRFHEENRSPKNGWTTEEASSFRTPSHEPTPKTQSGNRVQASGQTPKQQKPAASGTNRKNAQPSQYDKAPQQPFSRPSSGSPQEPSQTSPGPYREPPTEELSAPPMELSNERRTYGDAAPYPTFDFSSDGSGSMSDEQLRQNLEHARARMERLRPYNTLREQYRQGQRKGQQKTQYNKAHHEVIRLQKEEKRRNHTKGRIDKQ